MIGRILRRPAFAEQVARLAKPSQQSYPMIPQDWVWRYFPNHTRDRFAYFVKFNKFCMLWGAGTFWYYHTPYAGLHDTWEMPFYKWHYARIRENGTLARNLAIAERHSTFYDGGGETEEDELGELEE